METTLTSKGQVTLPKRIRDSLKLEPGCKLIFDLNDTGDILLHQPDHVRELRPDRFDLAVGASEIKWEGSTGEYMELIRSYSDDPA